MPKYRGIGMPLEPIPHQLPLASTSHYLLLRQLITRIKGLALFCGLFLDSLSRVMQACAFGFRQTAFHRTIRFNDPFKILP